MIHYDKTVLSNGLTVIAEQDKTTTLAAVNILYKVGSRNEHPNRTGFAHLFEHLMFGGSLHASDYDTPLQNAGGENNAFTNNDYTNYYNIVPVENIQTALWLEADRMANLKINRKSFDTQRKVVIEEFNEVCLNKPYGDNWHHLSALAYRKHPYQWPTIGKTPNHISEAKIEEVQSFYQTYYHPGNAILSISGPLETRAVFEMVEKWFGEIPSKKMSTEFFTPESPQTSFRHKRVESEVPLSQFIGAWHMPGRNHPDYYACDLLSDILGNGKSSRLYRRLVRETKVLAAVDCYISGTFDPGLIIFEGRPAVNIDMKEALEHIWKEIEQISNQPPGERELQKVKNKVISSISMNDLNILNKAASLAYFEWLGALDIMNHQEELYAKVTVDDIIRIAEELLIPSNASVIEYIPVGQVQNTSSSNGTMGESNQGG